MTTKDNMLADLEWWMESPDVRERMEITKSQYYEMRRGYNHMVATANILKEIPEVEKSLPETLHLIARDVWKLLVEAEVTDDYRQK